MDERPVSLTPWGASVPARVVMAVVAMVSVAGAVALPARASTVVVVGATAIAAVWTWPRPQHLAWLVGLLLPVQVINGVGNTTFEILHVVLVGVLLLRFRPRLDAGIVRLVTAFGLLLLAVPVIRLGFSLTRDPGLSTFKFFGVTTAAVIVATLLARRTDAHRSLVSGLLAGVTVSSVVALTQAAGLDWVRTANEGPRRYPGLAIQAPGLSWHLLVAIIIAVGIIATSSPGRLRTVTFAQLAVCGAAIIVCGAQGGLVGLALAGLVYLVVRWRATGTRVHSRHVLIPLAVLLVGGAVAVGSGLGASSLGGLGGDPDKGYENELARGRSIRYGIEQLVDHPLTGTSTDVYDRDHEVRPHFIPLNLSIETGVLGLLVGSGLVLLLVGTVVRGPRKKTPSAFAGTAILAGVLVQTGLTPAGPFAEVEAVAMLLVAVVATRGGSDLFSKAEVILDPPSRSSGPRSGIARVKRSLGRNGVGQIVTQSRPLLAEDQRKLPTLVAFSFVMGLLEAFLVLMVVQMAVALAAGRQRFDVRLGPLAYDDLPLNVGVGVSLLLVALLIGFLIPVARLAGRLVSRAQHRTRRQLLGAYLRASWEVRSHYPEGHLQELLTTYSQHAEKAVNQLVIGSVALCGLTSILLVAFVSSAVVAAGAIIGVVGVGALLRPIVTRTRAASRDYSEADRAFAGRTAEIARVTPEITAFDVAEPVEAAVDKGAAEVAESLRRVRTFLRMGSSLYQYLALLLVVLAIGAVSLVSSDARTLATMGTVLLLLVRALSYGQQLQSQIQVSSETQPFLEKMAVELDILSAAEIDRDGVRIDTPVPLRFDDVRFAYEPSNEVIRGISFDIQPGEALGIVGPSGAGKSTLVQLLLRLHSPSGGVILVDGVPLDHVALDRWYDLVAYVPQENKIITGTVADNIRFFRHDIADSRVRFAAQRAHLEDEVDALPQGFDTPLGPGVRELSGGQRQRLGIARALAGDPRLIILDEPTSSLDPRSEALVARTLAELRGAVTTVIVAHRAATTAVCDRILRIEGGTATLVTHERAEDRTPATRVSG